MENQKLSKMELPKEYRNVMLTYEAIIRYGIYGEKRRNEIVTRRAFYCKSNGFYDLNNNWVETPNGYFLVPIYWQPFTFSNGETALLPYKFTNIRVYPENIIKWEYDKN